MTQRTLMLITSGLMIVLALIVLGASYGGYAALWGFFAVFGTILLCVTLEVGHEFFD